jgi:hypothetical protein
MTLLVNSSADLHPIAIGIYNWPTGVTAEFVVTFSSGMLRCNIGVWAVEGMQTNTAYSTDVDISDVDPVPLTVSCPEGGAIIAVATQGGTDTTATTTNLTQDFAQEFENQVFVGGSKVFASAQTNLDVSIDMADAAPVTSSGAAVGLSP